MTKTSGPLYRKLTPEDLGQVAALEAACFSTPWTAEQYRAILQQRGCVLFGALCDDALAGYIAVAVHDFDQNSEGEMEVYNIAVDARFRRRGVGKKLLRLALEAAKLCGAARAVLEVRASNVAALALYRSLGFSQAGVRRGYYHDTGEDALILVRSFLLVD